MKPYVAFIILAILLAFVYAFQYQSNTTSIECYTTSQSLQKLQHSPNLLNLSSKKHVHWRDPIESIRLM